MKRLAGQAGRTLGWVLHHTGMILITVFFLLALALGLFAFRLSAGPIQIPWLSSRLASIVSGQGIDIHIERAALAWGGYRQGGAVPLYLQLGGITARNATGVTLATIRTGRLVFFPSALLGGRAPILVSSTDTLFQGSDVKVAMRAAIQLGGFFSFSHAELRVTLGAGALGAAGVTIPITGGRFALDVTPRAVAVTGGQLALAPRGHSAPQIGFAGAGRLDGAWHGQLTLTADQVAADDLAAYWPAPLLAQTRAWVTANIGAGTARAAAFTFALSAPKNLSGLSMDQAAGGFTGETMSVGWIPGAPPITGVTGTFRLTDKNDIDIAAATGTLAGLTLTAGTLHITGLTTPTQVGRFTIPVDGPLQDALRLLNAPPFNLLAAAPPDLRAATGHLAGTVAASLPLRGDVTPAQVDLHVQAALTEVNLPLSALQEPLTDGALALTSTLTNLTLTGPARLAGQPARLALRAAFNGGPPNLDADLASQAGAALLARLGLAPTPGADDGVAGNLPFDLHVTQQGDGPGTLTLQADLTPAALGVPALGWHKQAGLPGHLNLTAALNGETLAAISSIQATAAGLDIQAARAGGRLNISALRIGASAAHGSLTPPAAAGQPWDVVLSGPVLDITAILNPPPAQAGPHKPAPPKPAAPTGPLWHARLTFNQLILAGHGAPALRDLAFDGAGQGETITAARASATGHTPITLTLTPTGGPRHASQLQLATGDAGYLLKSLGAFSNIEGGTLDLAATKDDAGTNGTARLRTFRLLRAPAFGKVLQALTIYGAAAAASGPGLTFAQLVAPFAINQNILTLQGARAFSSSLGFTASGTINLASGQTDLSTTIVPAYALNILPGEIPLIGKLFSAEKGGGLFAIRAHISGPLTDPDVTVNPLSALTPGVLRDIFGTPAK